jgi:hypothetical protein
MGQRTLVVASCLSSLLIAAAGTSFAQNQPPRPGQAPPGPPQRSQPMPPPQQQQRPGQPPQQQSQAPKPYKPVAITAPAPVSDPSFEAFRKQLAAIAQKKDRKALAALVASNFFWMGEKGDKAQKGRPGIENLAKAIQLDAKDGSGWDAIDGFSADPTGSPYSERPNTICAPADPNFNSQEFEALTNATGTDDTDWGFPTQPGLEVRGGPQPNAPVIEKLGLHFVRVMDDEGPGGPPPGGNQMPMLKIVTPSGKVGYVPIDAVSPLVNDQICYVKEASGWKIAGFLGGDQ